MNWTEISDAARAAIASKSLGPEYSERLEFEIREITKQAANEYWVKLANSDKKYEVNKNNLVLPYLLGITPVDPLSSRKDVPLQTTKYDAVVDYISKYGSLPSDFRRDGDQPDIDVDCLPMAREEIKNHAIRKFGINTNDEYGNVCSVGTWQTYLFKSALADVARATGACQLQEVLAMTKTLPVEVDDMKEGGYSTCKGRIFNADTKEETECGFKHNLAECPKCNSNESETPTLGKLLSEYQELASFNDKYPKVVDYASRLIGRIKTIGMHAGAVIITDRPLYGNVPLARTSQSNHWVSMWTEGRNTQLSKFGYTKWDILGLNNLQYIFTCCQLIEKTHGISFGDNMHGWDDIDPLDDRAGHYIKDGIKHKIALNDPAALKLANERKTDAIFQFDTPLAKQILSNGVRNFRDLMIYNAMGHPGPMQCCCSSSKINTDIGLVSISDLDESVHKIEYLTNDVSSSFTSNYKVFKSKPKQLLSIRSLDEFGVEKEIKVTKDHQILTKNGWIRAGDLTIEDEIAEIND